MEWIYIEFILIWVTTRINHVFDALQRKLRNLIPLHLFHDVVKFLSNIWWSANNLTPAFVSIFSIAIMTSRPQFTSNKWVPIGARPWPYQRRLTSNKWFVIRTLGQFLNFSIDFVYYASVLDFKVHSHLFDCIEMRIQIIIDKLTEAITFLAVNLYYFRSFTCQVAILIAIANWRIVLVAQYLKPVVLMTQRWAEVVLTLSRY